MSNNNWFRVSHRKEHYWFFFFMALFGTALMSIGGIIVGEAKDCQHDARNSGKRLRDWDWRCWDWVDVLAGGLGALAAMVVHGVIVGLVLAL